MNILIDGQTFLTPEIHRGIGIYTKNVINYMLKLDYMHSWYICLSDASKLKGLDPWVQKKIHVIESSEMGPGIEYGQNSVYTKKIESVVEEYRIDIFWIPNALMVNVLFLEHSINCKVIITLFDIIPYMFPVKEWTKEIRKEYLRRLDFIKTKDIELVFISKASAKDYIEMIGKVKTLNVTPLAANNYLFYQKMKDRIFQERPYILFTGGFDYRKNIDGAIAAYELAMRVYLDDKDFQKYRFIIVGDCNGNIKVNYEKKLEQRGLADKVILTGYVTDEKLAELYKNADIFFFPSKYEGFGLPILEAMLAGTYIVSADNSSLPEVCGNYALFCDANDVENMASVLYQAYCNRKQEQVNDIQIRQEYARSYSWEKTARKTLEIINKLICSKLREKKDKDKIAILTPWPKQKTGIASYIYNLTPYLAEYFDIDIYTDADIDEDNVISNVSFFSISTFKKTEVHYQHVLYEIGNNVAFHKTIYEIFETKPDIVEIHDYVLAPFFYELYFKGKKKKFKDLLKLSYGKKGGDLYQLCLQKCGYPDVLKYPMSESVVKMAKCTIVHNSWSKMQLNNDNIKMIPLACFDAANIEDQNLKDIQVRVKEKIGYHGELIIGCFGWINTNKRPLIVLDAVKALIKQDYEVKLVFWGESNTNEVFQKIENYKLQQHVCVTGYLKSDEYEVAMEMTDIVINLRHPSMGESSATLCEAFKHAKAVIVSELNQYDEYPDEVCWKVPVCKYETKLLIRYLQYLVDNPSVRNVLGNNAKCYADYIFDPNKIALQYFECLNN